VDLYANALYLDGASPLSGLTRLVGLDIAANDISGEEADKFIKKMEYGELQGIGRLEHCNIEPTAQA
jgi:hypothetical protein